MTVGQVLSFLDGKLEDLCISRPKTRLTWGIDLPFDDKFVTYVWFDALLNYASALKTTNEGRDIFDRYWPGCNHLIAKDILKTHAVYWPTMLMAAKIHEQKPLFDRIDVHGYWLSGDSKMSKSLGNVVRPLEFDSQFGIENLRYFFFREMKFGNDSNFTYELFVERYNADLANGLGNLLSRTAAMVKKNLGGAVPTKTEPRSTEPAALAEQVVGNYRKNFESRDFQKAISDIRQLLQSTDVYINEHKPWKLAREEGKESELEEVLYTGLEVVRIVSILLSPIMPKSCANILGYLGENRPLDGKTPLEELCAWGGLKSGYTLDEPPKAFPRIDKNKLAAVIEEAKERGVEKGATAGRSERRVDMEPIKSEITIDDFAKVDLRVGLVKEASLVEGADKLIRLMVDLGEEKPRQIFAGVRTAYPEPEKLVGTKVIVVANLKPRQMRFGLSEGMIVAADGSEDRLCVAAFDSALPVPGDKVT